MNEKTGIKVLVAGCGALVLFSWIWAISAGGFAGLPLLIGAVATAAYLAASYLALENIEDPAWDWVRKIVALAAVITALACLMYGSQHRLDKADHITKAEERFVNPVSFFTFKG